MIGKFIANIILWLFVKETVRDIIKSLGNSSDRWEANDIDGIGIATHENGRVVIRLPKAPGIYLLVDGEEIKLTALETAMLLGALKKYAERRKAEIITDFVKALREASES